MTTNKPEVCAIIDKHRSTGVILIQHGHEKLVDGDRLIRLSDYEALQAECEKLRKHLQNLIDQTTPLEPEPGNPMWSRRIQLDEVIAERDQLRAECESLLARVEELEKTMAAIRSASGYRWMNGISDHQLLSDIEKMTENVTRATELERQYIYGETDMTTDKPEVVAWRWRKPVVNDQGETIGYTAWELSDAPGFCRWWTNEPLIRLSDYEALQAECEELRRVADQYRRLLELGEDFHWENIIRVDISEFPSRADAINAIIDR